MLSEGSSVKGSPEDKQSSGPCIKEVPRFHGGALWHTTPAHVTCYHETGNTWDMRGDNSLSFRLDKIRKPDTNSLTPCLAFARNCLNNIKTFSVNKRRPLCQLKIC